MSATTVSFGSAAALYDDAARMRERAVAADDLAQAVRATDVGVWAGDAADAFGEALAATVRSLRRVADDSVDAAAALDRHGDMLEWARLKVAAATPASALEADLLLEEVREEVDRSAERAAEVLRRIAGDLEPLLRHAGAVLTMYKEYWGGIGDGVLGMVEGWWQFSPVRFAMEPGAVVADGAATASYLYTGLRDDPVGLAKEMIDYDTWRTNPLRAMGRAVPDLVVAAVTAGGGAAAAGGLRGIRSLGGSDRFIDPVPSGGESGMRSLPRRAAPSPRPAVSSRKLQNTINNLWKGADNPDRVGDGTTMDALRREIATGERTHGVDHRIKGGESLSALKNWLRRNPDGDHRDRLIAESLRRELEEVMGAQ